MLNLAADLPENGQLLAQNGSRWLAAETAVPTDAFEARRSVELGVVEGGRVGA